MLYLGLDAGATKTKAVLLSSDLKIVSEADAPGANAAEIGIERAIKSIEQAVLSLIKNNNNEEIKACFAIAGVDTKHEKQIWLDAIEKSDRIKHIIQDPIVINDTIAAIRSATKSKNAVVIIAGTGSNCWGINESGDEARTGGGAYILGDEGGAYDIGLKILKAVHKSIDGRSPQTILKELLFKKYNINNREELVNLIYSKPWEKPDIAQVAQLIEKAAEEKDETALKILKESINEIVLMIETVVKKLDLQDKEYDLVTTGSVFNIEKLFKEEIKKRIREFSPKVKFPEQMFDSATAAAYLAKESA